MRARWPCVLGVALLLAGCGSPAAAVLHGSPSGYLLPVDALLAPGFSADVAAHPVSAADIAAAGRGTTAVLTAAGLTGAAAVDFFRPVNDLSTSNGPVQVGDTVEEFGNGEGATASYRADVGRLDAAAATTAVSTGALGDDAHAVVRTNISAAGVTVVEIIVEWRVENVVDILVVRGRDGATRLEDALALAHRQTVIELGLATPTVLPARPPSPPPRASPTAA